jgi:hypothetical protein
MSTGTWVAVSHGELNDYNDLLRKTDANLQQYPYWNEPLKQIRLTPLYLKYVVHGEAVCYICILQIGLGPLRFGLVRSGPVSLVEGRVVPDDALDAIRHWSTAAGLVFLRFSHPDPDIVARLAAGPDTHQGEPFPFYRHQDYELHVTQCPDDERTLAGFQAVARRQIRSAARAGFRITSGENADDLGAVSSLFDSLQERKGVVYSRPFSSYVQLLRLASPYHCARVYTAWLDETPVQSALIVRDRTIAHYLIGALDVEALGDHRNQSPSCLLHWTAMRDFHREGTRTYDLGAWGSRGLPVFKRKFRPTEFRFAGPLTVVQNRRLYAGWCRVLPALQRFRGPAVRLAERISGT